MWLGLVACGSSTRDTGLDPAQIAASLRELLDRYEAYGFSGAVLVAVDGEVVHEAGYGLADRRARIEITPDTPFDFASIAKTMTGAAVLLLEADGRLETGDLLSTHLGPFPEAKATATIDHLVRHRAGLAHRTKTTLEDSTRAAFIGSMKHAPFESVPGEKYRYSNAGMSLAAALVEEVSGEPYEAFVRRRLIEPLGLVSTRALGEPPGEGVPALGYADRSDTPAETPYTWRWGVKGSGGLISTVRDIHRWTSAVLEGDVLPPAQRAKLLDAHTEEAFGWHAAREDGRRVVHKGGGLRAMQAQVRFYPDDGVLVVWAHNDMTMNWRRALNQGICAIALGEDFDMPPRVRGPEDDIATPGTSEPASYRLPSGTGFQVTRDPGGLRVGENGLGIAQGVVLRAADDGSFVSFDPRAVEVSRLIPADPSGYRVRMGEKDLGVAREVSVGPSGGAAVDSLGAARRYAAWLVAGEADSLFASTRMRPLRGFGSTEFWRRASSQLVSRAGAEEEVLEESWRWREGRWRYWRRSRHARAEIVQRWLLDAEGRIESAGMGPADAVPETGETKPVSARR